MSESAGRMWVAKHLQDGRAIDREQERQEKQAAVKLPVTADAITHHHQGNGTALRAPVKTPAVAPHGLPVSSPPGSMAAAWRDA